jgi:hypothetical protein
VWSNGGVESKGSDCYTTPLIWGETHVVGPTHMGPTSCEWSCVEVV